MSVYQIPFVSQWIRRTSPITSLPIELLCEIAIHIPDRHPAHGYVIESTNLASFSLVSRTMHAVALPLLYKDIPITSERQLHAFQNASDDRLAHVRELSIFMGVEFLDAWKTWAIIGSHDDVPGHRSVYTSLVKILSRTPAIESLCIRVAENSGVRSAWRRFALSQAVGMPFGPALQEALTSSGIKPFLLPMLHTIELDGFDDLEGLLRLTPNLWSLSTSLSAGFAQKTNVQLVDALKLCPGIKELVYTPESLRMHHVDPPREDEFPQHGAVAVDADSTLGEVVESSLELVERLGETLPQLEKLDLQSRWWGYGAYFCSTVYSIQAEDIPHALRKLPNLKTLSLPSSLLTAEDLSILRTPLPPSSSEFALSPDAFNSLMLRHNAIDRVSTLERNTIQGVGLGEIVNRLKSISFVRHVFAEDRTEYAVRYDVHVAPPSRVAGQFTKPGEVQIDNVHIAEARDGQTHAWPFTPPTSFSNTVWKMWAASPEIRNELIVEYAQNHQALALVTAGVGGCLVGEAGHMLYKYTESELLTLAMLGGVVYVCGRFGRLP